MIPKGLVTFVSGQQCFSKFTLMGFTKGRCSTSEKNSTGCGMGLGELAEVVDLLPIQPAKLVKE